MQAKGGTRRARGSSWTPLRALIRSSSSHANPDLAAVLDRPAGSRRQTAALLEGVCDVDLDVLDVELPRGFGRD